MAVNDNLAKVRSGIYPRGFSSNNDWPWPLVQSSEIVDLQYGKALRAVDRVEGSVPVYGTNGQCGWHNEPLTKGPGVILGRKGMGPLGVEWCDVPFWVIDTAYYIKPKLPDLDLRYFYYLVKYIGLNHLKDGTSNPSLSRDTFAKLLLPIPNINEQRAISFIVKSLDDKIELNRRMNQTLEAMARAIFKSWFVDFDPVWENMKRKGAKAQGRKEDKNNSSASLRPGVPALSFHILDLFPDGFEDSDVGEIPKGWNAGTLKNFASLKTLTIQPKTSPEKTWEHYSIPAFDSGIQPIWEGGINIKSGKYKVPRNSVLASKLNPQFPRIWLPDIQSEDSAICSTEFMPFVPTEDDWRPFLYEMLRSNPVQYEILNRVTGSTGSRQRVKPKEIAVLPCLIPPKELVGYFCERTGPLHNKQLSNRRQSTTLAKLRDTLLPKLISGELRVPDAEKFLEEAGL